MIEQLTYSLIANQLPVEWKGTDLRDRIRQLQEKSNKKMIVLDDDPTGVQTVHDIDVLTGWDKDLIREALQKPETVFYILTNSRGYEAAVAEQINREIVENALGAASEIGVDVVFISRSDSTLRGHYPLEIDVLADEVYMSTGKTFDAQFIIPAFFEGGRVTYDNVHYVIDHNKMIPAHETEFARDKVFGFQHGDLRYWVEEKTNGRYLAENCAVISLEDLRLGGPDRVEQIVLSLSGNVPVIVNALSYADLDVLSLGILQAESKGKRFIFRTAASFVKSYGGIDDKDYLSKESLVVRGQESHGGLVIVGSHVKKTTNQLEQLIQNTDIVPLEMNVNLVMNPFERETEIERIMVEVNQKLAKGINVVVYSSRDLVAAATSTDNLKISQTVSASLIEIVRTLQVIPKFIIAKGGITSSDVATKGLNIQKARVLGQVSAGIPVWQTGHEAKFSGIPFIVFPGNVGDEGTLLDVVQKLN